MKLYIIKICFYGNFVFDEVYVSCIHTYKTTYIHKCIHNTKLHTYIHTYIQSYIHTYIENTYRQTNAANCLGGGGGGGCEKKIDKVKEGKELKFIVWLLACKGFFKLAQHTVHDLKSIQ